MSTTDREIANQEKRVRRACKADGLRLVKSRTRNPLDESFGLYNVIPFSFGDSLPGAESRASWRCTMTLQEAANEVGLDL